MYVNIKCNRKNKISTRLGKDLSVVVFSKTKRSIIKSFATFNQQVLSIDFYISIIILGLAFFSSSTKCS